jgi:hypothetical protein
MREVQYSIFIELIIEMSLNETYGKFHIDKNLYDTFHIQRNLKQGDALSLLLSTLLYNKPLDRPEKIRWS